MLYKKKLDTCFDTHGIKIGVQLWRRRRDLGHYGVAGIETGGKQVSAGHLH